MMLSVGPSRATSSGLQPTSAGTPGNVVPVTREGDDHDQRGDDQKAGGFQGVDMRARMMGRARLARWREDRHSDIVSPVMDRKKATVQAVLNYCAFSCRCRKLIKPEESYALETLRWILRPESCARSRSECACNG